jgi:hypothetical protein
LVLTEHLFCWEGGRLVRAYIHLVGRFAAAWLRVRAAFGDG